MYTACAIVIRNNCAVGLVYGVCMEEVSWRVVLAVAAFIRDYLASSIYTCEVIR